MVFQIETLYCRAKSTLLAIPMVYGLQDLNKNISSACALECLEPGPREL